MDVAEVKPFWTAVWTELPEINWSNPTWLAIGAAAALALGLALAASRIAYLVASRAFADRLLLGHVVRLTHRPMQLLFPLAALGLVLASVPGSVDGINLLRRMDTVSIIAILTISLTRGIDATADWILRRHRLDVADNLDARRAHTRTRVLSRSLIFITLLVGLSTALMTFPSVRKVGISLLASAGAAGLVIGLAAKTVFGNLVAGLQIAMTQPIRIDDVLVIQGEWGRVEEITSTYVVLAIWDKRRLIIPLQWFIENPFANWTHNRAEIIGTVFLWVDFSTPLEPLRAELTRILQSSREWDGQVDVLQVTDWKPQAVQLRALCSAADSGRSWDLCCRVREGLLSYLQRQHPDCLPRLRIADTPTAAPAAPAPSAAVVTSPTP